MLKKLFRKENLILSVVIFLVGQNVFLQIKINKATEIIERTEKIALNAAENAAIAVNNANTAAYYAKEALEKAEEAFYMADDAYMSTFGQVCSYCP